MGVVPISECTEDVVKGLLSIIYTSDYQKDTSESSALSVARLGHKLDMKVNYSSHPSSCSHAIQMQVC